MASPDGLSLAQGDRTFVVLVFCYPERPIFSGQRRRRFSDCAGAPGAVARKPSAAPPERLTPPIDPLPTGVPP